MKKKLKTAIEFLKQNINELNPELQEAIKIVLSQLPTECERNLRVKQIDDTHQEFNGHIYHVDVKGRYCRTEFIHVAVFEWHNNLIVPKNHVIHHNGLNNEGKFDKSKNDIEYLQIMTKSEHRKLHNFLRDKTCNIKTFICKDCGKEFQALDTTGRRLYCSDCTNNYHPVPSSNICVCPICGKEYKSKNKHQPSETCSRSCGAKLAQKRRKVFSSD